MFNYDKFENDVLGQMEAVLDKWAEEKDDLYIFSLDCARGMESIGVIANTTHYLEEQAEPDSEDYGYYKYCEEEWELYHAFEAISTDMGKYLAENGSIFSGPETHVYSEAFDRHCEKIIGCCQNALACFRKVLNQNHSNLLLTFNIRGYLDGEERMEIFKKVNSGNAIQEYSRHLEEFE